MTQPDQQRPGPYQPQNSNQQPYNPYNQLPQQQNQYPQVGYFGGAPEPKKNMPWWGWLLIIIGALVVIGILGILIRSLTPSSNPTVTSLAAAPTVTQAILTTSRAQAPTVTAAQVITTNPTQRPIPTALPTATIAPSQVGFGINGSHSLANIESRKPKAGFVYYILDVTVTNKSDKPLLTSPLYFKIQSNQGFSYEYGDVTYLLPKGYKSTTLAPGEVNRGEIAFEMPDNETIISGRYEDVFGNKMIVAVK